MRKLLTIFAVFTIGLAASSCSNKKIQVTSEKGASQEFISESAEDEPWVNYGDTLCVVDGKTYMYSSCSDYDEIEIVCDAMITSYKGSVALDSCRVKVGTGVCTADGKILKIAFGVDTLRYDVTKLPKSLDPMTDILPKDVKKHYLDYTFSLNDSAMKCKFKFTGFFPDDVPVFMKNYIAGVMYTDLKMIFDDFEEIGDYYSEYEHQNLNPKRYLGLNTAEAAPKDIGKYFAKRFERLYKKEFSNGEGWGPTYEYMMEVAPAWTSEDGKLSTYRFYSYNYGGGAHGMMYEYYLTFDTASGKILGNKDLYGKGEFEKAMVKLGDKVRNRLSLDEDVEIGHPASLGKAGEDDSSLGIWYENCDGYIYPRGALVKDGIVFSYQPYDIASFAEGILHFKL